MNDGYLIAQRVLLNNDEIGIVITPNKEGHKDAKGVFVYSPSRGHPSVYDHCNVKPLPNGQL